MIHVNQVDFAIPLAPCGKRKALRIARKIGKATDLGQGHIGHKSRIELPLAAPFDGGGPSLKAVALQQIGQIAARRWHTAVTQPDLALVGGPKMQRRGLRGQQAFHHCRAPQEFQTVREGDRIERLQRLNLVKQPMLMHEMRDHQRPPDAPGLLADMHRISGFRSGPIFILQRGPDERGNSIAILHEADHIGQNRAVRGQAQHRIVHALAARQFKPHDIVIVIIHRAVAIDIGIHPDHTGALVHHVNAEIIGKEGKAVFAFVFDKILGIEDLTAIAAQHALWHVRNILIGKKRDLLALIDKAFKAKLFHPAQRAANPQSSNLTLACHMPIRPFLPAKAQGV